MLNETGVSSTAHISFDNNGNVLGKYGVGIRSNDNNNDNNDDVNIKVDKRKRNIHIPR
jgi:hypothetical protein